MIWRAACLSAVVLRPTVCTNECAPCFQVHIGSKQLEKNMTPYVYKRRADGVNLINIQKT